MRVNFVYEGHRVKVKVTETKKHEILYYCNIKLRSASPVLSKTEPWSLLAVWYFWLWRIE